ADDLFFLLLARQRRGRAMRPAMMSDLVARLEDRLARLGKGFYRVTRNEPGGLDAVFLEQGDQTWRAGARTEFAARDPRRRSLAARDEPRDGIEIESETDDVPGHRVNRER